MNRETKNITCCSAACCSSFSSLVFQLFADLTVAESEDRPERRRDRPDLLRYLVGGAVRTATVRVYSGQTWAAQAPAAVSRRDAAADRPVLYLRLRPAAGQQPAARRTGRRGIYRRHLLRRHRRAGILYRASQPHQRFRIRPRPHVGIARLGQRHLLAGFIFNIDPNINFWLASAAALVFLLLLSRCAS